MSPQVSVITSTYNWPKALAQAIPTVLSQTFKDFEYLIVGDCCNDETEQLVKSFKDDRIKWYNLPENTGNQAGVNKYALTKTKGKYIAYLNHDDLWFPDHLEVALKVIQSRDLDIVNTLSLEIAPENHHYRGILGLPYPLANGKYGTCPVATSVIHTIDSARSVGGWKDWRQIHEVPTTEFFRKVAAWRKRYAIVSSVTSLKFHSAARKNSYIFREAVEQEMWAMLIKKDPDLRLREALTALACASMGDKPPKLPETPRPKNPPPGWQIEQWRRMRGLPPMLDLEGSELQDELHDIVRHEASNSLIQLQEGDWTLISPIRWT